MFKYTDFKQVSATKVVYLGNSYHFDHPKNLSKWDIACVLDRLQPSLHWKIIYVSFDKAYLVYKLMVNLPF